MSLKLNALATAVVALATAPVWACDDAVQATQGAQPAQAATVKVTTAANALIVVRDAQSGKLRAPTAEEIDALVMAARSSPQAGARASIGLTSRAFTTASGAAGLHLGEDAFSFSVARRNPDGSLSEVCVTGPQAAEKALAAARLPKPTSASKELPNE